MCDRRINGRPIEADVKFIAACNPYRKHTDKMISKLESAGLGFFVKATDTQQKLGKIPLRQLVYRVLDLPPSMKPLVYDFGQLNNATEKDYTRQIVKDRCHVIPEVTGQTAVIESVANVLAWSQKYMRGRNDECSFVSLRDVERAMIVFKENRYLLFLTENYAALQVIKHFLHEEIGIKLDKSLEALSSRGNSEHRMEPFVLFGSSFPKDREYTQVCRNINLIKICMETGRTVILLNLKNLYESLYNLLNQYYIILAGGQRYVDLGLQTHRVKCRVHNDF
uniref:Uncharacterized protein n=1 Tax=Amphimedon queenslandica TaxID=400682 RepID=A0A1X7SXU1_AMPQE